MVSLEQTPVKADPQEGIFFFFESLNSPKLKNLEEIAGFLNACDISK